MRGTNDVERRLVEAAVTDAISGAQWERIDLQTRRPGVDPQDLMLANAAELAMSPIARDQLMSLALERGAQRSSTDRPMIALDCVAQSRDVIAARIFAMEVHRPSGADALVTTVEERHAKCLGHEIRFDLLAQRLQQEALLQEALWNHPEIPASDAVRLAMLCSIPRLQARALALSSSALEWWTPFFRWLTEPRMQRVR